MLILKMYMCLKRLVCLKCVFRGSGQVEMMSLGLSPVTRNAEQWEISEEKPAAGSASVHPFLSLFWEECAWALPAS